MDLSKRILRVIWIVHAVQFRKKSNELKKYCKIKNKFKYTLTKCHSRCLYSRGFFYNLNTAPWKWNNRRPKYVSWQARKGKAMSMDAPWPTLPLEVSRKWWAIYNHEQRSLVNYVAITLSVLSWYSCLAIKHKMGTARRNPRRGKNLWCGTNRSLCRRPYVRVVVSNRTWNNLMSEAMKVTGDTTFKTHLKPATFIFATLNKPSTFKIKMKGLVGNESNRNSQSKRWDWQIHHHSQSWRWIDSTRKKGTTGRRRYPV